MCTAASCAVAAGVACSGSAAMAAVAAAAERKRRIRRWLRGDLVFIAVGSEAGPRVYSRRLGGGGGGSCEL
uniref:Uncharacterized protein n=1 Tax=Arundo donax TaxID=35708 RepID=A0A0A9EHR5_ARUDO